jgi:hypothetical protein
VLVRVRPYEYGALRHFRGGRRGAAARRRAAAAARAPAQAAAPKLLRRASAIHRSSKLTYIATMRVLARLPRVAVEARRINSAVAATPAAGARRFSSTAAAPVRLLPRRATRSPAAAHAPHRAGKRARTISRPRRAEENPTLNACTCCWQWLGQVSSSLEESDPQIFDIIEREKNRQMAGLQLIPSENFTSVCRVISKHLQSST